MTTQLTTTKAMTISLSNAAKVQRELDAVQGRATARTLDHADVVRWAEKADAQLEALGINQKSRKGATAIIDPYRVANAYRSAGQTTRVHLARNTSGWVVTRVERGYVRRSAFGAESPDSAVTIRYEMTDRQRLEVYNRMAEKARVLLTHPAKGEQAAPASVQQANQN